MTLEQRLEAFIDGLGLKYFKGHELTPYWSARHGHISNHIPPEELWPNIVRTLVVADKLRELADSPLRITSSYRAPEYNATCPGAASGSYHTKFMALDLAPARITPEKLHHLALKLRGTALPLPHEPNHSFIWHGGLGAYPTFVHIDTRGTDADWG